MVNAVNWRTGLVGAHRPRPLPPKSITIKNFTKENNIFTTNEFNLQNTNPIKKKSEILISHDFTLERRTAVSLWMSSIPSRCHELLAKNFLKLTILKRISL